VGLEPKAVRHLQAIQGAKHQPHPRKRFRVQGMRAGYRGPKSRVQGSR
jgi:hypothetical protein